MTEKNPFEKYTKKVEKDNSAPPIPNFVYTVGDDGALKIHSRDSLKGGKGDKGEQGDKGDKGETGPQGETGARGAQGLKGEAGAKGDKGDIGPMGPSGPLGRAGDDGKGIADATINEDGDLILSFTDETNKNVGLVVGRDGSGGNSNVGGIYGISLKEDGVRKASGITTLNFTGNADITRHGAQATIDITGGGGSTTATAYSILGNNTGSTATATSLSSGVILGTPGYTTSGFNYFQMTATSNNFAQFSLQNSSSGSSASSDFIVTANNGTDGTHYSDFGMNNSAGGSAPFTAANAAYLYTVDNELNLGALGASGVINFYTTGVMSPVKAGYFGSSQGFVVGTPTGTDKGAGTINATTVYRNGNDLGISALPMSAPGAFAGNVTIYADCKAAFGYTINSVLGAATSSGTITLAVKINGTNVTGLSAVSITSTPADTNASAANTVVAGDIVTWVFSSNSAATDLRLNMKITRT